MPGVIDREQIRVAVSAVRGELRDSSADALITELGQRPELINDVAEQRAVRIYTHLTGQTTGLIREAELAKVHIRAMNVLQEAWLEGWLVGARTLDGLPVLSLQLLAEAARSLDAISEERGSESVWGEVDVDERAAMSFATQYGEQNRERLRRENSPLPRKKELEIAALAALWQDGLVIARLLGPLLERAGEGQGPRAGDDIPETEL